MPAPGFQWLGPSVLVALSASWSPDGAALAMTISGMQDPDQTRYVGRETFDGALISEEVYRDVTGNLPPAINPLLQRNELRLFELGTGATRTLRAADSGGDLFANVVWAPDSSALMVRMVAPSKPAGRTYPSYHARRGDLHGARRHQPAPLLLQPRLR